MSPSHPCHPCQRRHTQLPFQKPHSLLSLVIFRKQFYQRNIFMTCLPSPRATLRGSTSSGLLENQVLFLCFFQFLFRIKIKRHMLKSQPPCKNTLECNWENTLFEIHIRDAVTCQESNQQDFVNGWMRWAQTLGS